MIFIFIIQFIVKCKINVLKYLHLKEIYKNYLYFIIIYNVWILFSFISYIILSWVISFSI